jgi:hypothetical protein
LSRVKNRVAESLLERVNAGFTKDAPSHSTSSYLLPGPHRPENFEACISAPPDDRKRLGCVRVSMTEHCIAAVLQRVRDFLPQIEASNAALAEEDPRSLDIEEVGVDEEQYIQMNLGLGVYRQRRRRSSGSSSASTSTSGSCSSTSKLTSGSESNSSSDSEGPIGAFLRASRPVRPLPQRVSSESSKPIEYSDSAASSAS